MKHFCSTFLLMLAPMAGCFAQLKTVPQKQPQIVLVQTGIGFQWFNESYKLFTVSAEHPVSAYWHLGLQSAVYMPSAASYDFSYAEEFLGGFELGFFAKHFLHGRFSGRKSGLYLGPEIRYGRRHTQFVDIFTFPTNTPVYEKYSEGVTKFMMRWGIQWQFGHASFELTAPFGIEFFSPSGAVSQNYNNEVNFVLLPTVQLGFGF